MPLFPFHYYRMKNQNKPKIRLHDNSMENYIIVLEELTILDEYAQKISRLEGDKFNEMHAAIVERFKNKIKYIYENNKSKPLRYILNEIYNKIENKGLMYNEFFRDEMGLLEDLIKITS